MWFERNVMYSVCIRFECSGRVTDGFPKKPNIWIGGWVGGLSSIQFFWGFLDFFKLCKAPKRTKWHTRCIHLEVSGGWLDAAM